MSSTGIRTAAMAALAGATVAMASGAQAQGAGDYPNKPIRIVMSGSPGGSTDVITRVVTARLTERWGQPFVIENISGASGAIAAETGAKAPPNGYTWFAISSSTTVAAAVGQTKSVNFRTAYAFMTNMVSQPYVMVVNAALPVSTVKELVEYAKKNPGKLNFASLGVGSATHLGMELFNSLAGTSIVHIPFKGTNQAELAIAAGQVNVLLGGALSAMPMVKAGKSKALAVTSAARSALLPTLPTIMETGISGFEMDAWFGLAAPANTPQPIVNKVHADTVAVLKMPEVRDKLMGGGSDVTPSASPADFANHIHREMDKWERFIKTTGIKLQ